MRIRNLFRNSFFSMLSQFALLILGFFSQRAMNLYMGAELVGMNGVISNVINILSVTELGISTAIVYHLYGALARKDCIADESLPKGISRLCCSCICGGNGGSAVHPPFYEK